jgi:DNA-directed RNA polymerase subunit RPC12/RpoP
MDQSKATGHSTSNSTVFRTVTYVNPDGSIASVRTFCAKCNAIFTGSILTREAMYCPNCARWIEKRERWEMPAQVDENKANGQ